MAAREAVALGHGGVKVSRLGLGTGQLGGATLGEPEVERVLRGAFERGLTLFDTAPSYGLAEERLGRHLGPVRDHVVLSTKLGYGIEGVPDWTGACITAGVERARQRLQTDVIDVAHLHSCPVEVLTRGDVVAALQDAVASGKVRVAAYSGEGEALAWAVASGAFGCVQASINVCDQASARGVLRRAQERGLGVLAKRPLANAPWRPDAASSDDGAAQAYRARWQALGLGLTGRDAVHTALRFVAFHTPAQALLLGTSRLSSLDEALAALDAGPLEAGLLGLLEASFTARGRDWWGQV